MNFIKDFTSVTNVLATKKALVKYYSKEALNVICSLIRFEGLPEYINENDLQYLLFVDGSCVQLKLNEKTYFNSYEDAPPLDAYYRPLERIVLNPWNKDLKTNKFTEGVDCVTIQCDPSFLGYGELISWYANNMADCDITLNRLIKNSRYNTVFLSSNKTLKESIEKYIKAMEEDGNPKVIEDKALFDLIKTKDFNTKDISNNAHVLLEMRQYLKAQFYLSLGLPANYDMKPEYKSKDELSFDNYVIAPKIDTVIETLNKCFEKSNALFGTNISVVLGSSLKEVKEDIERERELEEAEIEQVESTNESNDEQVDETIVNENVDSEETNADKKEDDEDETKTSD